MRRASGDPGEPTGMWDLTAAGPQRDDIEATLAEASALIKLALDNHQAHKEGDVVERLPSLEARRRATLGLAAKARLVLRCVAPPPGDGLEELIDAVSDLPCNGTRVHMLCSPKHLSSPVRDTLLEVADKGVHVRVAKCLVPHLVVADGGAALLGTRSRSAGTKMIVVRTSGILLALQTFFFNIWSGAASLDDHVRLSDRSLGKMGSRVLNALSAGHTDDVAARELGMSVRTYRRHVADIMRELGATSRFEAGVRAAALGLLSAGQCAP